MTHEASNAATAKPDMKSESRLPASKIYIAAAVIVLIAIIVVIYMTKGTAAPPVAAAGGNITKGGAAAQIVEAGDNVSVYYTGTLTNGTVFDSNVGKQPLNFTVGAGEMIEGFDQGVVGMGLNETKNITIPANQAYGEVNPALIISVPRSDFGNQSVSAGMSVTSSGGQRGVVKSVNSTNVTIDFNPPLAGQTLNFEIKVVSIKK